MNACKDLPALAAAASVRVSNFTSRRMVVVDTWTDLVRLAALILQHGCRLSDSAACTSRAMQDGSCLAGAWSLQPWGRRSHFVDALAWCARFRLPEARA